MLEFEDMKCLECNSNTGYPICDKCKQYPFLVEACRQKLASSRSLDLLKKTYTSSFAEVNNLNSKIFWDKNFENVGRLKDQDRMTRERVGVVAKLIPKGALTVLDIGIGLGFVEELIAKRKLIRLYGNDISSKAITSARERFAGQFKLESLNSMEYSKNYFDAVLLLEVLEHVSPSKTFSLLKKIGSYLKKEGVFVLSIPINEGLEYMSENPNGHVRVYTEKLIEAELNIAGFDLIILKKFYAFKNYYLVKKILSKILVNRWRPNVLVIQARKI